MTAAMVRAQAIRGYRPLVKDLGGNPTRLLRNAGIDPAALDQTAAFISFDNMIDLLERSAVQLDCPDFGLRLAERQDIGILGTLSVAMLHSATVGNALDCASKYFYAHNPAVAFTVVRKKKSQQAWLEFDVLLERAAEWAQTAEHGVGLAWRIVALLSEGQGHLREVRFPHAAVGSLDGYHSQLDAPITFEAERCALALDALDLDLAIRDHHQALHDLAATYLEQELAPSNSPLQVQVRRTIRALLGSGTCGYREVASALYMNPRTLQRRLREEGATFEELRDEVRRDLAESYLSHPEVPLTQVAALLDYSEQSALGRSCQRWFHTTPKRLRALLSDRSAVPVMA
jgi:AraC-like DNA-binding protein